MNQVFLYPAILILGILSAYLTNYLADVLPLEAPPGGKKSWLPTCPECDSRLGWGGYLGYRKCPGCQKPPTLRRILVLVFAAAFFTWQWFFPTQRLGFWIAILLYVYFSIVFVIDLEHKVIVLPTTLTGFVIGAVVGVWIHGVTDTAIGGVAGFAIMWIFYQLGIWFVRLMRRWRNLEQDEAALGYGDVYLSCIAGLLLGFPGITAGLLASIFLGGLVSAGIVVRNMLFKQYKPFQAIPYAPFIILGVMGLLLR